MSRAGHTRDKMVRSVLSPFLFCLPPYCFSGLPWWFRHWRICLQCGRLRFDSWVGKIPWRRKWQPTPVFLPRESHGQRSLAGYSPRGSQRVRHDRAANTFTFHCFSSIREDISWQLKLIVKQGTRCLDMPPWEPPIREQQTYLHLPRLRGLWRVCPAWDEMGLHSPWRKAHVQGKKSRCLSLKQSNYSSTHPPKAWEKERKLTSKIKETRRAGRVDLVYTAKRFSKWSSAEPRSGTSLVVQWVRIHLPMRGTWVHSLVQEDPVCHGATKPRSHSYWACGAQWLRPKPLQPELCKKRGPRNKKPERCNQE